MYDNWYIVIAQEEITENRYKSIISAEAHYLSRCMTSSEIMRIFAATPGSLGNRLKQLLTDIELNGLRNRLYFFFFPPYSKENSSFFWKQYGSIIALLADWHIELKYSISVWAIGNLTISPRFIPDLRMNNDDSNLEIGLKEYIKSVERKNGQEKENFKENDYKGIYYYENNTIHYIVTDNTPESPIILKNEPEIIPQVKEAIKTIIKYCHSPIYPKNDFCAGEKEPIVKFFSSQGETMLLLRMNDINEDD